MIPNSLKTIPSLDPLGYELPLLPSPSIEDPLNLNTIIGIMAPNPNSSTPSPPTMLSLSSLIACRCTGPWLPMKIGREFETKGRWFVDCHSPNSKSPFKLFGFLLLPVFWEALLSAYCANYSYYKRFALLYLIRMIILQPTTIITPIKTTENNIKMICFVVEGRPPLFSSF